MKQLLSKYNAVLTAKNGHEALETLRSNTVDVVITDINMPILDGHELLNNIRADKNLRHIKVIATSSDDEQIYAADKKSDPRFDHILIKPFDEKEISSVIYSLKIESELHSSFE